MYGLKTETLGNLGEVETPFPNHLLRGFDFHTAEVVHDPVTGLLVKQLLKLAAADHIVPTDLRHGQRLIQTLLQIVDDALQTVAEYFSGKEGGIGE